MHPTYKGPIGGSTLFSHTASTANKTTKKHHPPPPSTQDDFNKNLLKKQTSKKNSSPHRNGRQPQAATTKNQKAGNSQVFDYGKKPTKKNLNENSKV